MRTFTIRRAAITCACLGVLGLPAPSPAGEELAPDHQVSPGPVVVVGIVEFQDESGLDGLKLGAAVTRLLRQRLLSDHRNILPKPIAAPAGAAEGAAPSVEQLQALGAQYAARFVVFGGVLPIATEPHGEGAAIAVPLYADVVSVEGGTTRTLRVEASVTTSASSIDTVEPQDVGSPAFAGTPLGEAVANAVARLAEEVYQSLVAPPAARAELPAEAERWAEAEPPAEPGTRPEVGEIEPGADAGDTDAELQQVVADAESAIACYGNDEPALAGRLRADLEELNRTLARKADLMASGQDTREADASLRAVTDSVAASTGALLQAGMSRQEAVPAGGEPARSGESALAHTDRLFGETLSLIQRVQDLRTLLAGASRESESAWLTDPGAEGDPYRVEGARAEGGLDSLSGSVTGVVVEDGQPVSGAEVTEASTGLTTTTASDGSYLLGPLPPGLTGLVQIRHRGKVVAAGRVPVSSERSALADFQLGKTTEAAPVRVLGSAAMRPAAAQSAGALSGQVLDAQGRPAPRVLVRVPGGGVVRTGSRGEFLMTGIPAGSYTLEARETALGQATSQVSVAAGGSPTKVTVRLSPPAPGRHVAASPLRLVAAGAAGARVHGRVRDGEDRSLAGAAVSLVSKDGTLTARTDGGGRYAIENVRPGEYRLVAARAGFETVTRGVSLRAKDVKEIGLRLRQLTPLVDTLRAAKSSPRKAGSSPGPASPKAATVAPAPTASTARRAAPKTQAQNGALQGRVIDARTRKPIAGVTLSVSGGGRAVTDRNGAFRIAGVPAGTWDVKVSRPGYVSDGRRVNVAPGRTVTVDLALRAVAARKEIRR